AWSDNCAPELDGADHLASIAHTGEHHDFEIGTQAAELLEGLQAVNAGHHQIEQHQVGSGAIAHSLYGIFAAMRGGHRVGVQLEHCFHVTKHSRFVIYNQHIRACAHSGVISVSDSRLRTSRLKGSKKENLLPMPGSLSTQIFPPWACTKLRATASPRPVPVEPSSAWW